MVPRVKYHDNFEVYRVGGVLKYTTVKTVFVDSVTVKSIYEKLDCCNNSDTSINIIEKYSALNFDIIGVKSKTGSVDKYIDFNALSAGEPLEKVTFPITIKNVVSDSTPIANLVELLSNRAYLFVNHGDKIEGIVTRADINKPLVRLYLFGLITILEMELNTIIEYYFPNNTWLNKLTDNRAKSTNQRYQEKISKREDLSLIECAQLCDKKDILLKSPVFLELFEISKSKFKQFMEKAQDIRDALAHSNSSITSEFKWDKFAECVLMLESFLSKSVHFKKSSNKE